jgi:uncharacterized protein (DUF362 family)
LAHLECCTTCSATVTLLMKPKVSIVKVRESVPEAVREAMELADWKSFVPRGAEVALKPNLGFDFFLPGTVTGPWVVEGVIQTIKGHVGQIYLVESGQILVNVERALQQTGMVDLCRRYDVPWVNMSKGPFKRLKVPDGLVLREVEVPEILLKTTLITIPVMKTHGRTVITGALKNQWGCLRELRHNYHLVLDEALADVNALFKPAFAVMDGTVGLEGNGPKSGRPKVANRVLASGDAVALDAIAAKVMGFDSRDIGHIQLCAGRGLGIGDPDQIEVVGEDASGLSLGFQRGRNNSVAVVEIALRRSFLRRLFFHTPLLNFLAWGAILWYYIWYYLVAGRRYRDLILGHPFYGTQWRKPG